jgi:gliding motility-associated-like protein
VNLIGVSSQNCVDSSLKFLPVYPEMTDPIIIDDTIGCSPFTANFTGQMSGVPNEGYDWDFGDGNTATSPNPSHIFENPRDDMDTSYLVSLTRTSDDNCTYTVDRRIHVYHKPRAEFELDTAFGCSPFTVQITNTSSADVVSSVWDYGDFNIEENNQASFPYIYENSGSRPDIYDILLTVENENCTNFTSKKVTVYPEVEAGFTADQTSGCSPLLVTFENSSQGILFNQASWNFGDGGQSPQFSPNHEFRNATESDRVYTTVLSIRSGYGCTDTARQDITVYVTPEAEFTAEPAYQLYPKRTVSITPQTEQSDLDFSWDFGDGSPTSTRYSPGQHVYDTSGIYRIVMQASAPNCTDTIGQVVKVALPPPVVNFDSLAFGCAPHTIELNNQTLYANEFEWDFGDGRSSNTRHPEHTYYEPGQYVLKLKAKGEGGEDEFTRMITVYEVPEAYFNISPNYVYVKEDFVRGFNLSKRADRYLWHFGDDSTSTEYDPTHIYYETGTYDVRLETWNDEGCYDEYTLEQAVVVDAKDQFKFPTAFRPNLGGSSGGAYNPGDGRNDVFYPVSVEGVEEYRLEIYNRWGVLIFVSEDINVGWDGYDMNGKLVKPDVYVWMVTGKFTNGKSYRQTGDVTILR